MQTFVRILGSYEHHAGNFLLYSFDKGKYKFNGMVLLCSGSEEPTMKANRNPSSGEEEVESFCEEYTQPNTRWDQLLSSESGQRALDRLADAALASIRAGEATTITFTQDGEIAPQ